MNPELKFTLTDLLQCEKYILSKLPAGLAKEQVISILNNIKNHLKNS